MLIAIATLLPLTLTLLRAASEQEWLTPAYPAQPSERHVVTLRYSYVYEERQFVPSYPIEPLSRNQWELGSPESAMIVRASAMKQLDYEGWRTTWDEASKAEMEKQVKDHGRELSDLVDQWRGVLAAGRMAMVRRVQTGQYVILTYRIVDATGRDLGQIELPSVFHLVDGRWLGTQDLSSDVLLLESPWVTGKQQVERTFQ